MRLLLCIAAVTLLTPAARAQDALCADRPGKATPACTVAPGRVVVETSLVDWTRDQADGARQDELLFGDTLVRIGIAGDTEVRVNLTPLQRTRTRTAAGTTVDRGFGDVELSVKQRLRDGGDEGISLAILPFVSLPVGTQAVSAGVVLGGVQLPVDIPLADDWSVNLTPIVEATGDAEGPGRHVAWSSTVAVSHPLSRTVTATAEVFGARELDPAGHTTQATADLLLAWQPSADWQLDASSYLGLTHATADVQLLAGITRRF